MALKQVIWRGIFAVGDDILLVAGICADTLLDASK